MSSTQPNSADTDSVSTVEQAIETYLDEKPYSSRFKARQLAEETTLDATAHEIKHYLSALASNGTLEKLNTAGASAYRVPDDSQLLDGESEHHTRQKEPNPTLSIAEVDEIRHRLATGESPPELVGEYDAALQTIRNAARGKPQYTHEAEHPPVTYDHVTKRWAIDEQDQEAGQ